MAAIELYLEDSYMFIRKQLAELKQNKKQG